MCDVCNSLFGHLESCPEHHASGDVYCHCCENTLENGELYATFPNGLIFCSECIRGFDMYDLCLYLDVDNAFELIEKFDICDTATLGRWK